MMKKEKISALQMAMSLFPSIIATAILSVPSITAQYARNDLWLSPILASVVGLLTVYIAVQLQKLYPGQTVTEFSIAIIGRFAGKAVGLIILLFYLQNTGEITRIYSQFINISFLPKTPEIVVIASMVFICACCVYGGLEVIGRVAQLLFPLFILPIILLIFFLSPDFEPANILPMFEKGVMPSIKGAIAPAGWFAEFFVITFFLPFLADKKNAMKHGMRSVIGAMLTLVIVNLIVLFVMGTTTANTVYPLMNVARYANMVGFFENMEAIVMAVWIAGVFVKTSVFFYAVALSTAQLLNLSDYRIVVWPLAILIIEFSFWGIPSAMQMSLYNLTGFPFYSLFIQLIIPLILLVTAVLRKKFKRI